MKENYVKPQIMVRNTNIKNYVICGSRGGGNGDGDEDELRATPTGIWGKRQLTKDRNYDIWNSGDDSGSIW